MKEEQNVALEEYFKSANILAASHEFEDAKKIYEYLLEAGYKKSNVHFYYGVCFEREDKWEEAKKHYQESIAFEPSLDAVQRLVAIYLRDNNNLKAANILERALHLDIKPSVRFELHRSIANCYFRSNQFAASEQHYQLALQIEHDSDEIHSNLGILAIKKKELETAFKAFQIALAMNPRNYKALCGLGSYYLAKADFQNAHDCFARALKIELNNPTGIFYLVKTAYALKSFGVAEKILKNYIDVRPHNADLLYSLAGLQFHLGKFNHSWHTLKKVLHLEPEHIAGLELQKKLSRYISTQSVCHLSS